MCSAASPKNGFFFDVLPAEFFSGRETSEAQSSPISADLLDSYITDMIIKPEWLLKDETKKLVKKMQAFARSLEGDKKYLLLNNILKALTDERLSFGFRRSGGKVFIKRDPGSALINGNMSTESDSFSIIVSGEGAEDIEAHSLICGFFAGKLPAGLTVEIEEGYATSPQIISLLTSATPLSKKLFLLNLIEIYEGEYIELAPDIDVIPDDGDDTPLNEWLEKARKNNKPTFFADKFKKALKKQQKALKKQK